MNDAIGTENANGQENEKTSFSKRDPEALAAESLIYGGVLVFVVLVGQA